MTTKGRAPKIMSYAKNDLGSNAESLMINGIKMGESTNKTPMNKSKKDLATNNHDTQSKITDKAITNRINSAKKPVTSKTNSINDKSSMDKGNKKNDALTKEEIFQKLGIVDPEDEKELDLSAALNNSSETKPNSKKDLSNQVISKLEKEVEKLKHKRDTYLLMKQEQEAKKLEKELENQALEEEDDVILHQSPDRIQKLFHYASSLTKPTLDNVEALLKAHSNKLADIEERYKHKKLQESGSSFSDPKDAIPLKNPENKVDAPVKVSFKKAADVFKSSKTLQKMKEDIDMDSNINPPVNATSTLMNEYLMEDKKNKRVELKKPTQYKNYKQKFESYLNNKKKAMIERSLSPEEEKPKDFERYRCTSPNRDRAKSPNKWDSSNLVENGKKEKSSSLSRQKSPTMFGETYKSTGSNQLRSSLIDKDEKFSSTMENKQKSKSRPKSAKKFEEAYANDDIQVEDGNDHVDISDKEFNLLQLVYNLMPKTDDGLVSKNDIYNCILKNPQVIELYDIDPSRLGDELMQFPSEIPETLKFSEFITFLKYPRKNPKRPSSSLTRKKTTEKDFNGTETRKGIETGSKVKFAGVSPKKENMNQSSKTQKKQDNPCLLPKETLDIFKEIFYELDKHEDLVVERLQLLKNIRNDVRIARILHKPAIHVIGLDKYLSLERILKQIEEEETQATPEIKKSKEFISLNQFMKFFTNYEVPSNLGSTQNMANTSQSPDKKTIKEGENPLKSSTLKEKNKTLKNGEENDEDYIEIGSEEGFFFHEIFESLPKNSGYVQTILLIDKIRSDERFDSIKNHVGRRKSAKYSLPAESIEEVINRIENEADSNIEFEEFISFFTRRGRPKDFMGNLTNNRDQELIDEAMNYQPKELGTQTDLKVVEYAPNRDGYDSDPEFHTKSKEINYDIKFRDAKKAFLDKNRKDSNEDNDEYINPNQKHSKTQKYKRRNNFCTSENWNREENEPDEDMYYSEGENNPRSKNNGSFDRSANDMKFTIPEPFYFDMREQLKKKKKTIGERKFEEMMNEKREEEEKIRNHVFRAKSVPSNISQPLFEEIMRAQQEKRDKVKAESIAMTKMTEKPFSFYIRDQTKPPKPESQLNDEFNKKFKAKPIPTVCALTDLWKTMKEKEEVERKERVSRLAQQNLILASLPPRMAKHEKEKKEKQLRDEINGRSKAQDDSQRQFKANPIPPFEKMQKMFQDLLDKKRQGKRPTVPVPFNFNESKKGVTREYLDIENQYKKAGDELGKRDPFEAVRKLKETKPKYQPPTTKKMVAMMDRLKQEREEKERQEELKRKEEEERLDKYQKLKPRVQGSKAIVDKTKEKEEATQKIKEQIKAQFKASQEKFKEMKQNIDERVASRPLLVEQESLKNKKAQLQAMKDLAAMDKIFKESGVKNTNNLFNEKEKEQLEDIRFLEKHGFKMTDDYEDDKSISEKRANNKRR